MSFLPPQKGFTLIELMIVIAIIGVLAALAIPAYQNYLARAQMAEALTLGSSLKSSVLRNYAQDGQCPTLQALGYAQSTELSGNYVQAIEIKVPQTGLCEIEVTMRTSDISSSIASKHVSLTLQSVANSGGGGSAQWECTSTDISQTFLPKTCTGI